MPNSQHLSGLHELLSIKSFLNLYPVFLTTHIRGFLFLPFFFLNNLDLCDLTDVVLIELQNMLPRRLRTSMPRVPVPQLLITKGNTIFTLKLRYEEKPELITDLPREAFAALAQMLKKQRANW